MRALIKLTKQIQCHDHQIQDTSALVTHLNLVLLEQNNTGWTAELKHGYQIHTVTNNMVVRGTIHWSDTANVVRYAQIDNVRMTT